MTAAEQDVSRATVVGGGRMGLGIAESFIVAGLDVTVVEAGPAEGAAARARLVERMRAHADAGLIEGAAYERAAGVTLAATIAAGVDGADLIVEAVTEDMAVKEAVLRACDAAGGDGTVIASNTSSLDIEQLAGFVARPERFLGVHWFNPAEWTPGVEVIPAAATDPAVIERVMAVLRATGKRPCVVASSTGFIANRLQMALFCEAARCVRDGLATPQDVDEVVRSCFGFRLPFFGPFQIADMAGLDVYAAVLDQHQRGLGDRFGVPEVLEELIAGGHRGSASGRGFYDYTDGTEEQLMLERDRRYAALGELLRDAPPLEFTPAPPAP